MIMNQKMRKIGIRGRMPEKGETSPAGGFWRRRGSMGFEVPSVGAGVRTRGS
jgi:hypothetical protein